MGWNFVCELAVRYDVWVITEEEKFRDEIEKELRKQSSTANSVNFYFVPKVRGRRLRKLWPPSYYWFYRRWHKKAYQLALQLHQQVHFDLVHQLNMVGFREPGYMWKLPPPFVWGPVGGMMQLPWRYFGMLGWRGMLFYGSRNVINAMQQRFCHRCRKAAKRAAHGLVAATSEIQAKMLAYWQAPSVVLSEIGSDFSSSEGAAVTRREGEPLRVAWAGMHIPRKALPLLLEAMARLDVGVEVQLDVLGDGAETGRWKALAEKRNISHLVNWHGWVSRADAIKTMGQSHVFVITSLLDLTSTVTLEALSMGVPVICLDHCGIGEVVTDQCGIKLPVTTPESTIDDMANALGRLYHDEAMRQRLSVGAINRAGDFTWSEKGVVLDRVYHSAIEHHKEGLTK